MDGSLRSELSELFSPQPGSSLPPEVMAELLSMLRLHAITPQELFFKWESYSIKMGADETQLDLTTARAFKADMLESLERENRSKAHVRAGGAAGDRRSGATGTPRSVAKAGHVFDM
jgi:DNA polymerase alpha subunit B